ncbi:MAG TPA: A/G-specific adenine glycosylase, partial [Beutenbergiaceae bacterium]|nr:A/G-specific adenine glycosylase [Beutenbergiaceae bacterium]
MHTDDHPLVQELTEWFTTHARSLPWRDSHPGPWGIFVVEVMSQQTPISRVVPVWEEWMGRW